MLRASFLSYASCGEYSGSCKKNIVPSFAPIGSGLNSYGH